MHVSTLSYGWINYFYFWLANDLSSLFSLSSDIAILLLVLQNNLGHGSVSEYDLGTESDLFKAPELIIEEPNMGLDPMAAAIAMMNSGEEVIMTPPQDLKFSGMEGLHQPLLSDVFYECRKDLLAKTAIELQQPSDVKMIPLMPIDEDNETQEKLPCDVFLQKSVSSGCLSSMEWKQGTEVSPSFVEFDFGGAVGMRRAFSEGDIKVAESSFSSILLCKANNFLYDITTICTEHNKDPSTSSI